MAISSFSFPHICFDVKTKHIPGNILLFVLVRFVSNQCQHLFKDFISYDRRKYFFALVIILSNSAESNYSYLTEHYIMLSSYPHFANKYAPRQVSTDQWWFLWVFNLLVFFCWSALKSLDCKSRLINLWFFSFCVLLFLRIVFGFHPTCWSMDVY